MYYHGGGAVGCLPCTTLDNVVKRLKKSDLVIT